MKTLAIISTDPEILNAIKTFANAVGMPVEQHTVNSVAEVADIYGKRSQNGSDINSVSV